MIFTTFGQSVLKIKCINYARLKLEKSVFTEGWHDVELFCIENQTNQLFWRHTIYSGLHDVHGAME